MDKYWKIYDSIAHNKNIPAEFKAALFKVIQSAQTGKTPVSELDKRIFDLGNHMVASGNILKGLIRE